MHLERATLQLCPQGAKSRISLQPLMKLRRAQHTSRMKLLAVELALIALARSLVQCATIVSVIARLTVNRWVGSAHDHRAGCPILCVSPGARFDCERAHVLPPTYSLESSLTLMPAVHHIRSGLMHCSKCACLIFSDLLAHRKQTDSACGQCAWNCPSSEPQPQKILTRATPWSQGVKQ